MPKVSVIVSVYNTENYLSKCISSICSQFLRDIEILCINDFSTDNSLKILKSFEADDSRIKIINLEENKGASYARNIGIKQAKGEYLAFIDSDDYIEEDFLYKLYEAAIKQNADIAKGNYRYEHDGYIPFSLNNKIKEYKTNFTFDYCSAIFRTSLIKNNKIEFPKLVDMEDPIFSFCASLCANKICIVDDAYINIVKRQNSLTYGIPSYDKIQNKFEGLIKFLNLLNENSKELNIDSYVFNAAYWISNCFTSCSRNYDFKCMELTAKKTFEAIKLIKSEYYEQFRTEFNNFGVNFEEYMEFHCLNDILKEYNKFNEDNSKLENKHIPIFLSSDENYAPFVATAIASVCYNTKQFIEFYILDGGISDFSKRQIEQLKTKFDNFSIEFIEIDTEKVFKSIDYQNICSHVTISTYNRFLIPSLKPEIKKAIYLDVDLIVLNDIKELYDINLGEYSIGAVPENIPHLILEYSCTRLKLSKEHKYFNAGVLLLDCEKLRNDNILEKLLKTEEENRKVCLQADQDVLNIFFDNNYMELPVKFNYMTNDVMRDTSKLKDIVIRHFNCGEKPWLFDKYGGEPLLHFNCFWFFAGLTPFYNGLSEQLQLNMLENIKSDIKKEIECISGKTVEGAKALQKNSMQNAILQAIRQRVQKDMETLKSV